jgi:hypothetical protein
MSDRRGRRDGGADVPAGVLTPGVLHAAFDALWNPPPPSLLWPEAAMAAHREREWLEEKYRLPSAPMTWIEEVKQRLGLVCTGDER